MAQDDRAEQSFEQSKEAPAKDDVLEGDEVLLARKDLADNLKSDLEERKRDYDSGKRRNTSSFEILKDLVVNIFDGDRKVVGKQTAERPRAGTEPSGDAIGTGTYGTLGRNPIMDVTLPDTPAGAVVERTTDENGFDREKVTKDGETVINIYDGDELITKEYPLPDGRTLSVNMQDGKPNGFATISERDGHQTLLETDTNGVLRGKRIDSKGKTVETVTLIDGKLIYEDVKTHAKRAESFEAASDRHLAYQVHDLGKYDANTGTLVQEFEHGKVVQSFAAGEFDVVSNEGVTAGFSRTGEMSWQNPETGQAAVFRPDGTGVYLRGDGTLDRWGPEAKDNAQGEKLSPTEQDYIKKHPDVDLRDVAEIHRRFAGSPEKLDAFYKSLEKVDSAKNLNDAEKAAVRKDIMNHVANPAAIYQGVTDSCNVSVIQRDLAIQNPAKYAAIIAEGVSEGKFTKSDGTEVKLDVKNLKMADSSGRDLASRIFQGAALQAEFSPARKYENTPDGVGRLLRTKDSPPGTPKQEVFSGLYPIEIAEIRHKITGEEKAVTFIGSQSDLEKALTDNGGPPMTILVDATHAPFGEGDSAPTAPNHVVTIVGIDHGPPVKYLVQNQYGLEHDHSTKATAIPADDLWANMSRHKEIGPSGNPVLTTGREAIVITKGDHTKGQTIVNGVTDQPQAVTDNLTQTSRSRTRVAAGK